jgi:hypothetical protein
MLIKIKRETVKELKRLKFHPRETYDDVIKVLSEAWREQHIHGWGSIPPYGCLRTTAPDYEVNIEMDRRTYATSVSSNILCEKYAPLIGSATAQR